MPLDCPTCQTPMPLTKPSTRLCHNQHKAGCWCSQCRSAWRAVRYDDGWRVQHSIGIGDVSWVFDGQVLAE